MLINKMIETIGQWGIDIVYAAIFAALSLFVKKYADQIKKALSESTATKDSIRAMLHAEVVRIYEECVKSGMCPLYALETAETLYKQYVILKGNGAIESMMKELRLMPKFDKAGETNE